jgi:cytoskeletal protein CcmA (bactofilin family)
MGSNIEIPSLINASSTIRGELVLTTDVRVDGKIFGKIETEQTIIIGIEGFVKGFLRANNLVVFGRIEGNIIVSGETTFHPGASLFGTLYSKVLEIKEGAIINARIGVDDELKPFEEAQLYVAEEMVKLQTNHMHLPLDLNKLMAIGNGSKIIEASQEPVSLNNHVPLNSKPVKELDFSSESKENFDEILADKQPTLGEDNSLSTSPQGLTEPKEMIQSDYQHPVQGPLAAVSESKSKNDQNHAEKKTLTPGRKSVLFTSLSENFVYESSPFAINDSEDGVKYAKAVLAQGDTKVNRITPFRLGELRNLLVHPKFPNVKPEENVKGQKIPDSDKVDESEVTNNNIALKENEYFLSDALKKLPVNDY